MIFKNYNHFYSSLVISSYFMKTNQIKCTKLKKFLLMMLWIWIWWKIPTWDKSWLLHNSPVLQTLWETSLFALMPILDITNHTRILSYKNIPYIGHWCQCISENVSIYCVKFINIWMKHSYLHSQVWGAQDSKVAWDPPLWIWKCAAVLGILAQRQPSPLGKVSQSLYGLTGLLCCLHSSSLSFSGSKSESPFNSFSLAISLSSPFSSSFPSASSSSSSSTSSSFSLSLSSSSSSQLS